MGKFAKTVAFIPIRGGSKSIPLKNISIINGRPLVYWVLDAVVACEGIDRIVVSTDSDKISDVVMKYGSDKIAVISRSEEVSTDIASTESVMLEFANAYEFENIVLVQATSPLLKSKDLNKGLQKFNAEKFDSILSVVRQKRFLWSEIGSSQAAAAINYNPLARPRRQDFSGFFVENGAFYITSKERLLASECRISGKIGLVEMPEETYFEIDEPSDWLIVEQLLKKSVRVENDLTNKLEKIKCFLTDCDGVLTDSGMYYSENGEELKKFNTKDGMGLKILKENGIITGIITGESVDLVRRRAEKLGVDILYLGAKNKAKVLKEICANYNLTFEEIAYVGDDINDLEVIKEVGFGCTVHDGMDILRNSADYVTKAKGGHGAVRELVELIMGVRGNKNGF